ncbi:MAG TPA: flavin reductase [Ignavibacteria bacterium]|nr:flavin reductase [Ignavibacteria bacterium]
MRKAYNIPDLPVYSLATYHKEKVNMNICTYVSAVSMKPKLYMISVYENTRTLMNLEKSNECVLQLLNENQFGLVRKLGQTSGLKNDKDEYLRKKNLIEEWNGLKVLKGVCAKFLLKKIWKRKTGDHYLYVFEVLISSSTGYNHLKLNLLREKKIVWG